MALVAPGQACHQKRVVEFGEWLSEKVLKYVPHRQWVFSIPKRLRIYFLFDQKLLTKLSRCAWKVLSRYLKQAVPYDDAVAGAVIAVQSFGDFFGFNSHLHLIVADPPPADYYGNGSFKTCPIPNPKDLEGLFRYEVFEMLKAEGKITDVIIENMMHCPPARRALEPAPRRAPQRIQCVLRQSHLAP
jgi:hypothetical protein